MLFPRNILKKPRDKVGFEINGFSFFFKRHIYFREREGEAEGEEGETQADSPLSVELDTGLNPMILRS